ncbi:MAG: 6-carboxytetrahydropterin synthase [Phycisphaerales bacterium]
MGTGAPYSGRMPVRLTRTVRCTFNPGEEPSGAGVNGYAGKPAMRGLGRFYVFDIACRGEPDPTTGYLINIKDIDRATRDTVVPAVARTIERAPETDPGSLLPSLGAALAGALPCALESLRWWLTPTYCVEIAMDDTNSVLMRQRFDFAAAHRLHVPSLSQEENRAVFGKCNNPSGHGHNYQVEPVVAVRLDHQGPPFTLDDLERLTDEHVIERFDHTHLNEDTDEFGASGDNPSVEHIAAVCYRLLAPQIEAASHGRATLRSITVWETDRTSCTYPA